MTRTTHDESVAQGVYEAFLTVLTTDLGFGPDYPLSRRELLDAVTEGVRQAFEGREPPESTSTTES